MPRSIERDDGDITFQAASGRFDRFGPGTLSCAFLRGLINFDGQIIVVVEQTAPGQNKMGSHGKIVVADRNIPKNRAFTMQAEVECPGTVAGNRGGTDNASFGILADPPRIDRHLHTAIRYREVGQRLFLLARFKTLVAG